MKWFYETSYSQRVKLKSMRSIHALREISYDFHMLLERGFVRQSQFL